MSFETIDSNYKKPEILGLQEFSLPFHRIGSDAISAFGFLLSEVNEGQPLQARHRVYNQILGDTPPEAPENTADIIKELEAIEKITATDPHMRKKGLGSYKRKLEVTYGERGGSLVLHKFQTLLGGLEGEEIDGLSELGIYEPLLAVSGLHTPTTEKEIDKTIEDEIVPKLGQSFGAYYNFIAALDLYSRYAYNNELRIDPNYQTIIERVKDKVEELPLGESYDDIADWLVDEAGDIGMMYPPTVFGDKAVLPHIKDRKLNDEISIYQAEATEPLLRYLDPEQKHQVDFGSARQLYNHFKQKYEVEEGQPKSRYLGVLNTLAILLTNCNSLKNLENGIDTKKALGQRAGELERLGISYKTDDMIFFYETYQAWRERSQQPTQLEQAA